MDISTLIGFFGGILAFLVAMYLEATEHGGGFDKFFVLLKYFGKVSAFLIIGGGTVSATILSFTMKQISTVPKLLQILFTEQKRDPGNIIPTLVSLCEKSRREGLLALEENIQELDDPFFQKGLQLVIDGTEPELVRSVLETELQYIQERHKVGADIFTTAGGYSPTMGIIGTVMGVVRVLLSVSEAGSDINMGELSGGVATAFVATFYGISFANLILLPIAGKMQTKSREEIFERELIIEGILAIQAGDHPRIVAEKLKAFFPAGSITALEEATK